MFSLPVYYSKINVGHKGTSLDSTTAAKWIINTIGNNNSYDSHKSYFHFTFRWKKHNTTVFVTANAICGVLLPSSQYWQAQSEVDRIHGKVIRHICEESTQRKIQETILGLCALKGEHTE